MKGMVNSILNLTRHNWHHVGNSKTGLFCTECGLFHYWRPSIVFDDIKSWIKEIIPILQREDCDGILDLGNINRYFYEFSLLV